MRSIPGACAVAALSVVLLPMPSGCGASAHSLPSPGPPAVRHEIAPGAEPFVVTVPTDRPVLAVPDGQHSEGSRGLLRVSAPIPGVMVAIDGGDLVPLPLSRSLEPGRHVLRAICPNGFTTVLQFSVEAGETTRARVCGP